MEDGVSFYEAAHLPEIAAQPYRERWY
jgi:hypothetical protein